MKTLNSRNVLSTAVSALMTMMVCSSVSQASDIEIYQNAKPSTITLMMLIDISGSMDYMSYGGGNACDAPNQSVKKYALQKINPHADAPTYRRQWCEVTSGGVTTEYPDRITRVKDGMIDLLFGNTSKGITALPDNNIIGLSTLGWVRNPLLIDPTQSDGRLLWDGTQSSSPMRNQTNMNSLAYGKTGTYKSERGGSESDWDNIGNIAVPARRLDATITVDGVSITQRKYLAQKIASLAAVTNTPTARSYAETIAYLLGETTQGRASSGYNFANPDAYDTTRTGYYAAPSSMTQAEADKQCNGQGVYVLTDGDPYQNVNAQGLIQGALGSTGSSFSCSTNDNAAGTWDCVRKLAKNYLLNGNNPKGVAIKTAVVGFGKNFNSVPSYDKNKSIADNVTSINASSASSNQKNAALWGVEGGGGWYSGSSSEDVVNSVKGFLNEIEVEIPAVATGSPTLPQDALNPLRIQPYGYYASFLPKPQESTQLWVGNMNKYHIFNGELYNASKTIRLIKADGSLDAAAKGLWTDEGMKGQLPLGIGTNAANEQVANRTIYTNREITGTAAPYAASEIGSLKKVNVATLFGTGSTALFVNDPDKNYWLNLLGYNVAETGTVTLADLITKPELRQVGSVMHSTPILLTQSGKISYTSGTIDTTDRDDYLLFGSTQGLLHVVRAGKNATDADRGKEVFTFVPHEMMRDQKTAFLKEDSTTGGSANLFYGIDAPWTAYTQYVAKADGTLTVKGSERNTDGSTYNSSNTNLELKGLQWVYGGLRMGGKSYYALNLSDITNPNLKFHIDPANSKIYKSSSTTTGVTALSYMGQSWSKPTIAYVNFGGEKKLVMFVGGGYDPGYENAAYDQSTTTGGGAGVYMFDANNGDLLWWTSANATAAGGAEAFTDASADTINMKYSVVSQINAIDRDSDGLVDNLYFGDLGGQGFRVDLNNAATGADASAKKANFAKRVVRLFDEHATGGASPRFYEMPSVSIHDSDDGYVAAVAFSSGNRSSPLVGTAVVNGNQAGSTTSATDGVFVVYDKDVAKTDLYGTPTLTTPTALSSLNSNMSTGVAINGNSGWKYTYSSTAGAYKGMNELYALDGMLYVNVFHRDGTGIGGSCGAGVKGDSYVYQFCLPTGKCPFNTTTSGVPNRVKLGAGILGAGLGQGRSSANNTGLIVNRPNTLNCTTTPNLPECQEFTTTAKLRQLRWYETR
ncbi:pilus assembly protein PilC [Acinetobacter sp. YT-02]|uniref:pilus assembly protein PilC n=1 Tax=Acinetobacter sp. YT-02 TaxID=2018564 RepID=UPI000BDA7379|nr:pilus assembly protein PilC [Acinetobacter sp. YT-02]PCN61209.1 pilus assembly protein PilC [Acinetobacter sp. YT-02]